MDKTHAYFHSDLAGGHARRPALPLEREDALRQDLHHLPARQEARRQTRARGHLQARRRRCVADGPRVPRGLRRLAVPLPQSPTATRRRSTASKPVVYFGSFQDLLGRDAAGNIKPKNEWLHTGEVGPRRLRRIPLRRVARDRQGAVRGRGGGGRQEGGQARVRRRPGGCERGPQRALGEGDRVPAHHDQGLPLSLRHAVPGAGHGRVHRGADLQLDLHRRAARQGGVRGEEPGPVEPLRRAAADAPADLPDAGRAAGDRERRGVRRV